MMEDVQQPSVTPVDSSDRLTSENNVLLGEFYRIVAGIVARLVSGERPKEKELDQQ